MKASTVFLPVSDTPPLRRIAVGRALAARFAEQESEVTRLVEAAYRLIRERGVLEPGVRDVLAEAGLANRSFYRHFASKDEFWLVLVEDVQMQLTALVREAVSREMEPVERVRAWMLTVLDQPDDAESVKVGRPFVVQAARLREAYPEVYRATGSALLDLLEEAIRDAVAAGAFRSTDSRADARAIFHLAMSVMQTHVLDRTVLSPAEKQSLIDFALRALRNAA